MNHGTYTGKRHHDKCLCGCHWVEGLTGFESPDHLDYARVGLIGVAFDVPCPANGPARRVVVAYDRPFV